MRITTLQADGWQTIGAAGPRNTGLCFDTGARCQQLWIAVHRFLYPLRHVAFGINNREIFAQYVDIRMWLASDGFQCLVTAGKCVFSQNCVVARQVINRLCLVHFGNGYQADFFTLTGAFKLALSGFFFLLARAQIVNRPQHVEISGGDPDDQVLFLRLEVVHPGLVGLLGALVVVPVGHIEQGLGKVEAVTA